MAATSNADFFSTCPISEPVQQGFTLKENMGGFGFDEVHGLFVPVPGEIEPFAPPQGTPIVNNVQYPAP
jgi:hypothetical protein